MISIKKMLNKSVFFKLFVGFLLVAVPIYSISIGATIYGSRIISEKVMDSTQEKLFFFTSFIEQELFNINEMLLALDMDSELKAYSLKRKQPFVFDEYISFNTVISKLRIIYRSSSYISDVFMLMPETNEQISVSGSIDDIDENKKCFLEDMGNGKAKLKQSVDKDILIYTITNSEKFILGVEISQSKILEALKNYQNNNDYHVYLTDAKTGKLLQGNKLTSLDMTIYENMKIKNIENGTLFIDGERYIVQDILSKDKLFNIVFYISEKDMLGKFIHLRVIFLLLISCSILIFLVFSLIINRQIHKPLQLIVRSMKEVEKGNYNIQLHMEKDDEFGYVYKQFNRTIEQIRTLIEEVLERKNQVLQEKIKQLQSHINPHFLFNCLYTGYRMAIYGENENVAKMCKYLGDYFRFITYCSDGEVSLNDEINYTVTYLNIQKLRYSDRLDYKISCPENLDNIKVPGLIIQPLVENSIRHGIEKVYRPGLIEITISLIEQDKMLIKVDDNGIGMTDEEKINLEKSLENTTDKSQHYGLWNIHWRLRFLFGETSGLSLNNLETSGFSVSFTIPIKIE